MLELDSDMEEDFGEVKLLVGVEVVMRIWFIYVVLRVFGCGVNFCMFFDMFESEIEVGF